MWLSKGSSAERNGGGNRLVAVAIDKDKGSQHALRWTIDNLLSRGQAVVLIHVIHKPLSASFGNNGAVSDVNGAVYAHKQQVEKQTKELFLTFHCFCTRKDIQCLDIILEDTDVAKALTEYVSYAAIENLVLGASSRNSFIRKFKISDVPTNVSKGAPDFCTVYVISKGKMSSVRNASRSAPFTSPLLDQLHDQVNSTGSLADARPKHSFSLKAVERTPRKSRSVQDDNESIKSPLVGGRGLTGKFGGEISESDTDISFVSSGRPSIDRMSSTLYDSMDSVQTSRLSTSSDHSFGSIRLGPKWTDISSLHEFSTSSFESGRTSTSSQVFLQVQLLLAQHDFQFLSLNFHCTFQGR